MRKIVKLFISVFVGCALLFQNTQANENMPRVTLPLGLTGNETIEEIAEIVNKSFGQGEFGDIDDKEVYVVHPENVQMNNMNVNFVAVSKGLESLLVMYRIDGTIQDDGPRNVMNLMFDLAEKYGYPYETKPTSTSLDIDGKEIQVDYFDDIENVMWDLFDDKNVEYEAAWFSNEEETVLLKLEIDKNEDKVFTVSLSWLMY